ncbi:MAG: hypothetical protein KDD82_20550 [Planctomycetes bacterium]|nr:hypothetical protein [Planctomycetota bacterium]
MRSPHARSLYLLLALCALPVARGQEPEPVPQPGDARAAETLDAVRFRFSYTPEQEVHPADFLALWARALGALAFDSPELRSTPVRMRFLTGLDAELSWREAKQILATYGVTVVETRPPGGTWIVRAQLTPMVAQTEPPPYRYVGEGEALPEHDAVVTAVFPIKHGAASQIFGTLRNLANRDRGFGANGSFYVPGSELIVITDLASRVRYYRRLIAALDVPGPRLDMRVFTLVFAPAQEAAAAITAVLTAFGQGGNPQLQQAAAGGSPTVVTEPRTNQLIVVAGGGDMQLVSDVIARIDRPVPDPLDNLRVYEPQAADATYLAGKLAQLLGGGDAAEPAAPDGQDLPQGPSQVVIPDETRFSFADTRIVADERRNVLMIQAPEDRMQRILSLLGQLDRNPVRVQIEIQIWEISEPDSLTLGVEFTGLSDAHQGSIRPILATGFGGSALAPNAAGTGVTRIPSELSGGGNFGFVGALTKDSFDRIPIVARALATHSETRLINRPFALTNDNTPVSFSFSDEIPYQTTNFVQGSGQATGVAYVDASSALEVTPQVNANDTLTLKISLNLSAFTAGGGAGLPPPKSSRDYSGVVTVPNNRYIVFGGLTQESESVEERKVPFLGDLPILGHLFKTWTRTRDARRLYVFVRPTILADPEFKDEVEFAARARREVHAMAKRDAWLPPLIPDSRLGDPTRSLVDEALDVFGTGSADPLRGE